MGQADSQTDKAIRILKWAGHVARMEEVRSAFKTVTGTPKGNRRPVRPRRRQEENIRMDLKEIVINTRNWIDLTEDRDCWSALLNVASNLHDPLVICNILHIQKDSNPFRLK